MKAEECLIRLRAYQDIGALKQIPAALLEMQYILCESSVWGIIHAEYLHKWVLAIAELLLSENFEKLSEKHKVAINGFRTCVIRHLDDVRFSSPCFDPAKRVALPLQF